MMTFMISIYYFCPTGAFRKNQKGTGAQTMSKFLKFSLKYGKVSLKYEKFLQKFF